MEDTRLMKLWYDLLQAQDWVTSGELARYAGVSERTVKSDLSRLRQLAEKNGCRLISARGKGYQMEVTEEERFCALEERLNYRFSSFNYTKEYEDRANQIVRILLACPDYIRLDDVADRLYLSRSSIRNLMGSVRETLEAFHLELHAKPGYGVAIQGEELNRRFCMLELFLDHDYRSEPSVREEEYLEYFQTEKTDIGKVRHDFLRVLRNSGLRIVDNNTHRLVRYFFLMCRRRDRGHVLGFPEEDVRFLRTFQEYRVAGEILNVLKDHGLTVHGDEREQLGVEILLLLWSDLNETDDLTGRYPRFYETGEELAGKILREVSRSWGINLERLPGIFPLLVSALMSVCVKVHFPYIGYNRTIGKKVENNMMSSSPVSMALALTAAEVIRETYGLNSSRSELFHYGERFYIAISRLDYEYCPRRILISAQSGNQSCSIIRDRLLERFGEGAFERLDTANGYEIRGLDQSSYDYLILNFAPYYYRYDLPVIYVDSIPDNRQINQIYRQVVLGGYPFREIQASFRFDSDFLFQKVKYEGRDSFLRLLSYKYCGSRTVEDMERKLLQYTDVCVWNGTAAIIVDARLTEKNCFHLYCLETPGIWEKKTVKQILFLSVNFQGNRQSVKYLEQLTNELLQNPESMEQLISTGSLNPCCELVKHRY